MMLTRVGFLSFVIACGLIAAQTTPNAPFIRVGGGSSSSGGGTLIDGGSARIDGTGFGTNTATVSSLQAPVDGAANDTPLYSISGLTAWSNADGVEAGSGTRRTLVSTTNPLYGTKSLRMHNTGSDGRFGVALDTGGTITDLFLRDYIRIETTGGATVGQWKYLRVGSSNSVQDDDYRNFYIADWFGSSFDFLKTERGNGPGLGGQTDITLYGSTDFGTSPNVWYEREFRIVPGGQGVANGRAELRLRRVSDFVEVANITRTDMQMYLASETHFYRFLILHNYQGNSSFDNGSGTTTVYMKGTWVSNGSQKRVYLCNTATWVACTQREIQDWTIWGDSSISFTIRKGTLSGLFAVWGYVVDGSGNVNANGYTVTAN